MELEGTERRARVCVTGAGGFAASWLVKLLLSKGYFVHGTVRDPSDEKRYGHLRPWRMPLKISNSVRPIYSTMTALHLLWRVVMVYSMWQVLFLLPMFPTQELLEPAITGTKNVLKASLEANVKRVIVVSSGTAVYMRPDWPRGQVLDESCWSDEQYCKTTGNWYQLSKTVAEKEAIDFASKNALDVITVCPTVIFGPMLQSTINASSWVIINLLKGAYELVDKYTRNTVDVRDLADALLLVYEKKEASGRYIASSDCITTCELINILKRLFPNYNYPKKRKDVHRLSSKKLQLLGWRYRPLEETLRDAVNCYQNAHLLD